MRVLFVCSGNICRSPAAVACVRHRTRTGGWDGIEADSAGTLGIEGQPMCSDAERVLRELGIDAGPHRSKGVRGGDVRAADWIVAMEHVHLAWLAAHRPEGRATRVLVRAFEHGPDPEPEPPDLVDPYGAPVSIVRAEIARLVRCVDNLLIRLRSGP